MTSSRRPDSFYALGVRPDLAAALAARGITEPFPIQAASLPDALAGRDVLGRGRTGSGKTVAFALPLLERVLTSAARREPRRPRALVLVPTRELAVQVAETVEYLAGAVRLRSMTVFGGVRYTGQTRKLERGIDIVVATPGRLEDLIEQGHLKLDAVEVVVLDEADMMADMGFLPPVTRILEGVPAGQRMLFSATLDGEVGRLVKRFLNNPATHSMDEVESGPDAEHYLLGVTTENKFAVVQDLLAGGGRTLVFTRTKFGAERLARELNEVGISAVELHGNLRQAARQRNLSAFADGTVSALVATDIAARGIHVDDIGLVVHVDPPNDSKAFLHRSGRTARAGSEGNVVTLATRNQNKSVRALMAEARIKAKNINVAPGDEVLTQVRAARVERAASGPSIFEPDPDDTIPDEPEFAHDTRRPRGEAPVRQPAWGREPRPDRQRAWGREPRPERRDDRADGRHRRPSDDRRPWREDAPGVEYRPRREPKEHTSGGRGARPDRPETHPERMARRPDWGAKSGGSEPWTAGERRPRFEGRPSSSDRFGRPAYDRGEGQGFASRRPFSRDDRGAAPFGDRRGSDAGDGRRPSFDRREDGRPSFDRRDDRRPSFDRREDGRPSFDRRDDRRPSFDRREDGRPSFDRRDDRRPSFDRREDGRPSFDRRDDRRPSFDRREDGRPSFDRRDDGRPPFDRSDRAPQGARRPGAAGEATRTKDRWTSEDRARAADSSAHGFGFTKRDSKSASKGGAKGFGKSASAKGFGKSGGKGGPLKSSGKGKPTRGSAGAKRPR